MAIRWAGSLVVLRSEDGGQVLEPRHGVGLKVPIQAKRSLQQVTQPASARHAIAAADSAGHFLRLGTGGKPGPHVLEQSFGAKAGDELRPTRGEWLSVPVPLASGTDSAGVFSLAFRDDQHGIAVGGDYQKPNEPTGTAAWTADGGRTLDGRGEASAWVPVGRGF